MKSLKSCRILVAKRWLLEIIQFIAGKKNGFYLILLYTGIQVNLLVFDLATMEWANITDKTIGTSPGARSYHGFAEAGGKLYVFGGYHHFSFKGVLGCRQLHSA